MASPSPSPASSQTPATTGSRLLRLCALGSVPVGAIGSLLLLWSVGHRNQSILLLMLFAAWVLSPFIGLAWLDRKTHRPSARVHGTMLLVVLVSWSAYGAVAFGPPRKTPAAVFLLCPLVSWLAIGGSTAAVLLASRRNAVTNAA